MNKKTILTSIIVALLFTLTLFPSFALDEKVIEEKIEVTNGSEFESINLKIGNTNQKIAIETDNEFMSNVEYFKEEEIESLNYEGIKRVYYMKDGTTVVDIIEREKKNNFDMLFAVRGSDSGSVENYVARRTDMENVIKIEASFEWRPSDIKPFDDNKVKCTSMEQTLVARSNWKRTKGVGSYTHNWVYYGKAYAKVSYKFEATDNWVGYPRSASGTFKVTCSDNGDVGSN